MPSRNEQDKARDAMRKRQLRHINKPVRIDTTAEVRDRINKLRGKENSDQPTIVGKACDLYENFTSEPLQKPIEFDDAACMFVGEKGKLIELLQNVPCKKCAAPMVVKTTKNLGCSINLVFCCKNEHQFDSFLK